MVDDWRDLRSRFLETLDRHPRQGGPAWRLFAEHPWYQRELRVTARRLLAETDRPFDLTGDIMHDALLLLARQMRRTPDLGFRRGASEEVFPEWLRTIMKNHCREALRTAQRHAGGVALAEEHRVEDPTELLDLRLDLYEAVGRLPQRERVVALLYAEGWTVAQIAEKLRRPYHTVYSIWQRAVEQLRHNTVRERRSGDARHRDAR